MRLPSLNYRSLFILYGASIASMLPFAVVCAYAHNHAWGNGAIPPFLFAVGIASAFFVWARIEPGLLARQPAQVNFDAMAPEIIFSAVLATSVAVVTFPPPSVVAPFCKTRERTPAASPLVFECGTQSDVPLQNPASTSITIRVSGTF